MSTPRDWADEAAERIQLEGWTAYVGDGELYEEARKTERLSLATIIREAYAAMEAKGEK